MACGLLSPFKRQSFKIFSFSACQLWHGSQKCNCTHGIKNFMLIFTSEEIQEQKLFSTKSVIIYTH